MLHAREDYARIQDPWGKIGADEPVFLLRGQDPSAAATVAFWALENLKNGGEVEASAKAFEQAARILRWPRKQPTDLSAYRPPPATPVESQASAGPPPGLCPACERGSHGHCSAQVPAANAPCSCEPCWGVGGSVAFYRRVETASRPGDAGANPAAPPAASLAPADPFTAFWGYWEEHARRVVMAAGIRSLPDCGVGGAGTRARAALDAADTCLGAKDPVLVHLRSLYDDGVARMILPAGPAPASPDPVEAFWAYWLNEACPLIGAKCRVGGVRNTDLHFLISGDAALDMAETHLGKSHPACVRLAELRAAAHKRATAEITGGPRPEER